MNDGRVNDGRVDEAEPTALLFLIADTGGGHRAAASAVIEALNQRYPGRFAPVMCDPLGGPRATPLARRIVGLYGPLIRRAGWIWAALYYGFNSRVGVALLRSTLLTLANRPVADAADRHEPAAIVSFHPLTGAAAVRARNRGAQTTRVVTVVTDLVSSHAAWHEDDVDRIVVPPAGVRTRRRAGSRGVQVGVPVSSAFATGPLSPAERAAMRRSLGMDPRAFLIVITGGGEGAGGIARRVRALLQADADIHLAVLCGRNDLLRRRLATLAARSAGRLRVEGFVDNVADWLGCADLVVTKAGPATIAEATCRGAPMLLTSHVPGQERGNTEFVTRAGAGRYAPTMRRLRRHVTELHRDPVTLESMRAACARLAVPNAAADIATLLAGLVDTREAPDVAARPIGTARFETPRGDTARFETARFETARFETARFGTPQIEPRLIHAPGSSA